MACCARAAPALLVHVSLLLAVVSGAGLATAARLKWDPSTYIVVRELFPTEYRVAAGVLCAAACVLLALAHLAALALSVRRVRLRRALLLTHATLMAALVCAEVSWAAWTGARVSAWLQSARAQQVSELMEVRDSLQPLLQFLSRWHPLPGKIQDLIQHNRQRGTVVPTPVVTHLSDQRAVRVAVTCQPRQPLPRTCRVKDLSEEAEEDAPRNLYVGGTAVVLVATLQPAAVLLALLCACAARTVRPRADLATHDSLSCVSTDNEKAPLKTAYRNGKLVIL